MPQIQINFATRSLQTILLKTEIARERSGLPKDSKNPPSPRGPRHDAGIQKRPQMTKI